MWAVALLLRAFLNILDPKHAPQGHASGQQKRPPVKLLTLLLLID